MPASLASFGIVIPKITNSTSGIRIEKISTRRFRSVRRMSKIR